MLRAGARLQPTGQRPLAGGPGDVFAAPKAALCQSGLGQFVQDLDGGVAHDCGLVTALEDATGCSWRPAS